MVVGWDLHPALVSAFGHPQVHTLERFAGWEAERSLLQSLGAGSTALMGQLLLSLSGSSHLWHQSSTVTQGSRQPAPNPDPRHCPRSGAHLADPTRVGIAQAQPNTAARSQLVVKPILADNQIPTCSEI